MAYAILPAGSPTGRAGTIASTSRGVCVFHASDSV